MHDPDVSDLFLKRTTPPGTGEPVLYADSLVSITGNSITFYRYSFPLLAERKVAFSDIDRILVMEPSVSNGRWRIWGSGNLRTWFTFDLHRHSRDRIFVAFLKTRGTNIGFTVENSARVISVLKEHGLTVGDPALQAGPCRESA
jgi:hypothetical protein